jgi:MFS family permease
LRNPIQGVVSELHAYQLSFRALSHNARMYLLASILLAFGMGVQLVLYNLYLLELGFREDLVGQVAAAVALGVAIGGLPAGLFYARFGGKVSFGVAIIASVLSMVLRAVSTEPIWLITWAVVNGLANSIFYVAIFPFITDQSTPRERPHLYGMNLAVWTGLMVLGSLLSGYLPGLWHTAVPGLSLLSYHRITLLLAAVLGLLAVIPVRLMRRDKISAATVDIRRLLPQSQGGRAIVNGALVLILFGIVLGLTQPFYNVYFKRVFTANTELIGTLISLSQLMGLVSSLFVPTVVRRLGLVLGPAVVMAVAAPLTLLMGLPLTLGLIAIIFMVRVGLEWLALTPLMNLIMEVVDPVDRGAMSGVRLVTNYGAQALAGAAGGWVVVSAGYTSLFIIAALLQLLTGLMTWMLFNTKRVTLETTASSE